jgi:hypothetical protein
VCYDELEMRAWRLSLGSVLVRFACVPIDAAGFLFVAIVGGLFGEQLSFRSGVLTGELLRDSWPARSWFRNRIALTVGHAVLFAPARATQRAWTHQRVHVDQAEAVGLSALLVAIPVAFVSWPAALALWSASGFASVVGAAIVAWLRGGHAHHDSVHERAAYALDGMIDSDRDVTRRSFQPNLRA